MRRYQVEVEGRVFDIRMEFRSDKHFLICNGREVEVTSHFLGESRALLLINGESHEVDVRSNGYGAGKTVFMKGLEIPVVIEDYNLAQLRRTAGMATGLSQEKVLRAAMPGLVLDVKVQAGDTVSKGQPLLIVEAMKMENIIKAQSEAVVKAVHVKAGGSVEKGDQLLEFE